MISKFLEHTKKELDSHFQKHEEFIFKEFKLPNITLYLVYEVKIRFYMGRLASYELKENGIICIADGEYFYYNFHDDYENVGEVIKEFTDSYVLG